MKKHIWHIPGTKENCLVKHPHWFSYTWHCRWRSIWVSLSFNCAINQLSGCDLPQSKCGTAVRMGVSRSTTASKTVFALLPFWKFLHWGSKWCHRNQSTWLLCHTANSAWIHHTQQPLCKLLDLSCLAESNSSTTGPSRTQALGDDKGLYSVSHTLSYAPSLDLTAFGHNCCQRQNLIASQKSGC